MGRGDSRTKKGKTFKGSYGNSRPHSVKKAEVVEKKPAKPVKTPAKPATKKK